MRVSRSNVFLSLAPFYFRRPWPLDFEISPGIFGLIALHECFGSKYPRADGLDGRRLAVANAVSGGYPQSVVCIGLLVVMFARPPNVPRKVFGNASTTTPATTADSGWSSSRLFHRAAWATYLFPRWPRGPREWG